MPLTESLPHDLKNKEWFDSFKIAINPIYATGLFRYPLKTSENLWFSDVFTGYRKTGGMKWLL